MSSNNMLTYQTFSKPLSLKKKTPSLSFFVYPISPNGLNSCKSRTNPSTPFSPPNNFPTIPFFSSIVRRTIFRVVPVILEESLPLLEEEDSLPEDEDVDDCGLGRVGSGMR